MRNAILRTMFVACALASSAPAALAQLDLLQTIELGPVPGTGTSMDFSSSPIPADFFGPGSDPFDGIIYFHSDPIDPPLIGGTDTIVLRSADPFDRADIPSPASVPVDIQLVDLKLTSVQPITVTFGGGGSPADWHVGVSIVNPQPQGQMQVIKTHDNGGVFDALLPVQPRLTFTDAVTPTNTQILDFPSPVVLQFSVVPWVHDVDPSFGWAVQPGANFVPFVEEVVPGNPASQQRGVRTGTKVPGPGPAVEHTLGVPDGPPANLPAAPSPVLVVLGLALLGGAGVTLVRAQRARMQAA